MPGPCSAPNGNHSLTTQVRGKGDIVKSGKTALKKGKLGERKTRSDKLSRVQRERLEAS